MELRMIFTCISTIAICFWFECPEVNQHMGVLFSRCDAVKSGGVLFSSCTTVENGGASNCV